MVQAVVGSKPTYTPANTLTHTATPSHVRAVDFSPSFCTFLQTVGYILSKAFFIVPVLFEPNPISGFFPLVCKVLEQHVESFVYALLTVGLFALLD